MTVASKSAPRTVSVTTLGCRSNQYDSSAIESSLREAGLTVVPFSIVTKTSGADTFGADTFGVDAYVINTCTVTKRTDYQSRQLIRRIRRESPGSLVIVTGCYAEVSPEEVSAIEGVDFVLGNPDKGLIAAYIKNGDKGRVGERGNANSKKDGVPFSLRARAPQGRTRVNLKVQDGCDRACSFCIIPRARGRSRSLSLELVLGEVEGLVKSGFREIVLTGIHLGAFGRDLTPRSSVTELLRALDSCGLPCRFRISSLDPDEVSGELIDLMAGARTISNHLHLPIQSGDDSILKLMRRPYKSQYFRETVMTLHERVESISIGTDVITGFPGEGDVEFENTYNLIKGLPLSYLHVFPYSKRSGTPAAKMAGQVKGEVIKERSRRLRELDVEKREEFYKRFIGSETEVLIESARDKKTGLLKGRTSNYIPVFVDGPDGLKGKVVSATLKTVTRVGMEAIA